MKRDMDFIRELLLKLEGLNIRSGSSLPTNNVYDQFYADEEGVIDNYLYNKCNDHFDLLKNDGYFRLDRDLYYIGLSWKAHDFLDSVRDPVMWEKTKKAANAAGGFSADLLKDIAKGFIKKQVEEYSGIKIS